MGGVKINIAFITLSAKAEAGISVSQSLLPAIDELDHDNQYYVFFSSKQEEIRKAIPDNFIKKELKYVPSNPYSRVLWEQLAFPFYLKKNKIDILYSIGNITSVFAPCKVFLFMENANPFSKLKISWNLKGLIRNKFLIFLSYLSAKKATKIRFCSERSKIIISKILNLNEKKNVIIPHGLNFSLLESGIYQKKINYRYILSVSVVAPHKNIEILLKGFKIFKEKYNYQGNLLILGNLTYKDYYKKLEILLTDNNIEKNVIFIGKIPYNNIETYYRNADVFVFPSLEETFGIPLIEALYFGVPALVSDGDKYNNYFIPFNEIAKNYANYFDPFSESDLAEKLNELIFNRKDKIKDSRIFVQNNYDIKTVAKKLIEEFNNIGGY